MTAKLSYNENTPKATKTGRPIKGFEKWRTEAMNKEPMTENEYTREIVQGAVKAGANVVLKFFDGEKVYSFEDAGKWNIVLADFGNGKVTYKTFQSIRNDYNEYKTNFENMQNHIRNCI